MPVTKKYLNFAAHERYETVTDFSVQKLHKRLCVVAAGNVKLFFLRYVFKRSSEERLKRMLHCTFNAKHI